MLHLARQLVKLSVFGRPLPIRRSSATIIARIGTTPVISEEASMVVIIPPCQEPCCRVKRGESPRPETAKEAGRAIADAALAAGRAALKRASA
jgi:hypothetical protein